MDDLEEAFREAAVRRLRRRDDRQRERARNWTVIAENGAQIVAGEGRIAERLASALDHAADEIEAEAGDV